MKIYDGNFINLSVNGKKFMKGEKTNDEICLNDTSIIAGENIVVEKLSSGKIKISVLGAVEPDIPLENLYFTSGYIGIFSMFVGLQQNGSVNIYYRSTGKYKTVNVSSDGTEINKLFRKRSNRKTYIDDSGNSIVLFKCNDKDLNSLSLVDNAGLKYLDVKDNNIQYLDLTQNTNLIDVDISNNPVTEITCSSLFLENFTASGCNLSEVNLASQTLQLLDLSNNENLETLNVNLNGIKNLNVSNTDIEELDFSDSTIIENVDVSGSGIRSLTFKNALNLQTLRFDGCQINNFSFDNVNFSNDKVLEILKTLYDSNVYNGDLYIAIRDFEPDEEIMNFVSILLYRGWTINFSDMQEHSDSYSQSESISESSSESESESTWGSDSESASESESSSDIDVFVARIIEYNDMNDKFIVMPQKLVNGVYIDDPDREQVEVDY